jgi:hypothetical protein
MILGIGVTTYTLMHVLLSLVGIVAGLVAAGGLTAGRRLDRWTAVFLVTTIAASVTGFGFPVTTFLPSHAVAIVTLVVLPVVLVARYGRQLAGRWRAVYAGGVVLATWLNFFILIAQLFRRVPALIAAAPTQSETPFAVTQALVLALFGWLGVSAVRGTRAEATGGRL